MTRNLLNINEMLLFSILLLVAHFSIVSARLTTGTEFVVAFPCMTCCGNLSLVLVNGNSASTSVTIQSPYPGFQSIHETISAQSTMRAYINDSSMQVSCGTDANNAERKGIRIDATAPISVYLDLEMSDGVYFCNFLVLPVSMLSNEYCNIGLGLLGDTYNYGIFVAVQDNTIINLGGAQDSIVLNALDAYFLVGNFISSPFVTSNVPFAFISTYSFQPDAQIMSLPSSYRGREFPILADPNFNTTNALIFAFDNDTTIFKNGVNVGSLNAGQHVTIPITQAAVITTTKDTQISVGDHMKGYGYALSSFLSTTVIFYPLAHVPYKSVNPTHSLQLIVPLDSAGQVALDGQTISALLYLRIPNSSYYYIVLPVSGGQHMLTPSGPNVRFMASVFSTVNGDPYPWGKFIVGLNLT
uniref:IgGFc-binding protein N-terminal domain-containing protein n=1 Tax=Plectus sambesii TaxID=2011161 RepID=A0A914WWC5_9BILA